MNPPATTRRNVHAILLAAVASIVACKKPPATPPPPVVTPAAVPAPSVPGSDPSRTATPASPKSNIPPPVTVEALTEALRTYMQVSSDYPTNLQALVDRKLIPRLPSLPPGKKFAIDRQHIAVVVVDK